MAQKLDFAKLKEDMKKQDAMTKKMKEAAKHVAEELKKAEARAKAVAKLPD